MPSRSTFECFGLVIQGLAWAEVKKRLTDALVHGRQSWIVTANPEILLQAKRDPNFWQVIRRADLRLVDGFGLQLIGRIFGAEPNRLTGVDLAEKLLHLADEKKWKVLLLGGENGAADKAAWKLRERFPHLQITADNYVRVGKDGVEIESALKELKLIQEKAPDLMLVAFGHPKQEFWIERNRESFLNLKVIVGVGGTFDFWIDKVRRAPLLIQKLGFEWLWRLILEPKRWKRIIDAVIIFPWVAIRTKIF